MRHPKQLVLLLGLLGLSLVVMAFGPGAGAGSKATFAPSPSSPAPESEPPASAACRLQELTALRTLSSKTYQLADGKREWVGYAEPIHYLDASGAYQEIDNRLVREEKNLQGTDYLYRNAANAFTVRFGANAGASPLVRLDYRGTAIAFGLVGAGAAAVTETAALGSEALSALTYGEPLVAYAQVYPGVDLFYQPTSSGVKEYLVLRGPQAPSEFRFLFTLAGLIPQETEGGLSFLDDKGEALFYLKEPWALDEKGALSEKLDYRLSKSKEGYELTLALPEAYLRDPARLFPVIIDPSLLITGSDVTFDSYVSSRYPDTNYYLNTYLRTGRDADYYVRRTYIRFTLPTDIPGSAVSAAYLRIKKYSGAAPVITAYRNTGSWSSSTITWNNKPSYTTSECSTQASNDPGTSWWRMYNLTVVRKWLDGTYPNYGWMIKDATESGTSQWTTFYSSDAPSPNKPELHIEYVYCGNRPYETVNSGSINCMGYALDYPAWIDPTTVSGVNSCTTLNSLLEYVRVQSQAWMTAHNIGNATLATYTSDIGQNQYRVVLRVGWIDLDGDNDVDYTDDWDFHWWYQTSTGQWAQKQGSYPSSLVSGSSATTDPYLFGWPKGAVPNFYNSLCRYWAIDH